VFGYELLYRARETDSTCTVSGDVASASVFTDGILTMGLEMLTNGRPAFVNLTRSLLLNNGATMLPAPSCILEIGRERGFDEDALRGALLAGSAQSFALMVTPGLLRPSGAGATGTLESLHDLLKKDVDHAAHLAGPGDPALQVLLNSAQAMLDALRRRAGAGEVSVETNND